MRRENVVLARMGGACLQRLWRPPLTFTTFHDMFAASRRVFGGVVWKPYKFNSHKYVGEDIFAANNSLVMVLMTFFHLQTSQ